MDSIGISEGKDMTDKGSSNPFATLQQSSEDCDAIVKGHDPEVDMESDDVVEDESDSGDEEILNLIHESNLIHRVFLITINDSPTAASDGIPTHCVFLFDIAEQIKKVFGEDWTIIEFTSAQQAVFERLMCPVPSDMVINTSCTNQDNQSNKAEAGEKLAIKYLFECYKRLLQQTNLTEELFSKCEKIIVSIAATCLLTPDVINNQNVHQQVFDIVIREFKNDNFDTSAQFLKLVAAQVNADEMSCTDAIGPVLTILKEEMSKQPSSLANSVNYGYCAVISLFSDSTYLAEVLLNHMTPADPNSGKAYEDSSVGKILCLSCLHNKNDDTSFKFFEEPSRNTQTEHAATQSQIWQLTSLLNTKVNDIFINICKSSVENKHRMLEWLGNCMRANTGRGKMWSLQNQSASDGFFVNLGAVMLNMCHKFATPNSTRMLSVDFRYCLVDVRTSDDMRSKGVHLRDLPKSDFLRQLNEGESVSKRTEPFNFSTDCFFLTHRCLQLGFNVLHSRFMKVNRELHQYQQAFQEHQRLRATARSGLLDDLQENMEKATSIFLSMKAALSETRLTNLCMQFHTATAQLLVQYALTDNQSKLFTPSMPISEDIPSTLACVPAYVVENIVDFLLFVRRFQEEKFEELGEHLDNLLSFIIVFMGNKKRINNYHLRAKLADILDGLRPNYETRSRSNIVSTYHRQRIFIEHPLRMLLSRSLLTIFNDIEFSGDEHAFEQKFNYRIPMYKILHYLWLLEEHRKSIKDLSEEAMLNIEDAIPPLFVQFINLLINDAIFTLDEAMDYLKKIRELQLTKESPEWETMASGDRIQHDANLRTQGNIARYFNVMANESIKVLSYISSDIKDVFTHSSMVDRVAAMFNDFLVKLIGTKMGLLKVRNFDAYDFKPKQLVKDIAQIYVNLGDRDEFCEAVANDERSYTPGLFLKLDKVLLKIFTDASTIEGIKVVAAKVKSMSLLKETEDELYADAPDEFLDPLLSTLMTDPVLLPSSGNTVERSTIQRHIMSDPHDPFNRAPLTMDMVVPNDELRIKIQQWKQDKRDNAS